MLAFHLYYFQLQILTSIWIPAVKGALPLAPYTQDDTLNDTFKETSKELQKSERRKQDISGAKGQGNRQIKGFWTASPKWMWVNEEINVSLSVEESESILSKYKNGTITFMGDSQMGRLHKILLSQFGSCTPLNQMIKRCGIVEKYLGLKLRKKWIAPNMTRLEGPIAHGLFNHGCNDMSAASWGRQICMARSKGPSSITTEFLGVEFCRDVEMQNQLFGTTQESVVHYLQGLSSRPSLIVVNSGLHEVAAVERATRLELKFRTWRAEAFRKFCKAWGNIYERNLRWYLGLITRHLPGVPVVFLSTSLMHGNSTGKNAGKNILIRHFNERAARVVRKLGLHMLDVMPVLDNEECQPLFTDGIHLATVYYKVVLNLLLRLLDTIL